MRKAPVLFRLLFLAAVFLAAQFLLVQHGYQHVGKQAAYDCRLCAHVGSLDHALLSEQGLPLPTYSLSTCCSTFSAVFLSRLALSAPIRAPPVIG